ncbi:MAG: hypothetical protein ABIP90_05075 [Vicinamibacterales bacterium]
MSHQRRFTGKVVGFLCACAVLLMPVETGTQGRGAVQLPTRGRGVQVIDRVQIPADGRVMVMRPRPGQVTHLVISVADGGLIDGHSEPTEAGKQLIARFIASLRVDNSLDSYVFLVHSYSSPKTGSGNAGERGATAGAATATTATTARSAAGAARATTTTSAARGARAASATAAAPIRLQKMQTVQTVRGAVQAGRASAIQRQLVDIERIPTDRIRLYAHGESRPEAAQADASIGDYVTIDAHRLMAMMAGGGPPPPQGESMIITAGDVALPPFPWPPPKSTSQVTLRPEWLRLQEPPTIGQVGNLLVSALDDARYPHHSYLAVPHGFALVAQLEQIQPDGTPAMPNRWDDRLPSMATMGFLDFLKALVVAPTGNYRVIAFIVTDVPWQQNAARPTDEQAEQWLSTGLNALPAAVRDMRYTADYQSTALVYQFAKDTAGARFVEVSSADTIEHLDKAGLLRTLRR